MRWKGTGLIVVLQQVARLNLLDFIGKNKAVFLLVVKTAGPDVDSRSEGVLSILFLGRNTKRRKSFRSKMEKIHCKYSHLGSVLIEASTFVSDEKGSYVYPVCGNHAEILKHYYCRQVSREEYVAFKLLEELHRKDKCKVLEN